MFRGFAFKVEADVLKHSLLDAGILFSNILIADLNLIFQFRKGRV